MTLMQAKMVVLHNDSINNIHYTLGLYMVIYGKGMCVGPCYLHLRTPDYLFLIPTVITLSCNDI